MAAPKGWLLVGLVAALLVGCTASASQVKPEWTYGPHSAATDRLKSLIETVTEADGYRYDPHDDRGNGLTGAKIIDAPGGGFVAVSFWPDEATNEFVTNVSTSDDLLNWTWRAELGRNASQPTIADSSDGGYVVGWEQEPPNHLLFAYYKTYDDLLAARPTKVYEPPTQLSPNCAEGTPSFYEASSTHLDVGFHYFRTCERDLQARGSTDWTTWTSSPQPQLDAAIDRLGVHGGIGDRDGPLTFDNYEYMIFEGQIVPGDWETFQVFLYDVTSGAALQLRMQTHAGSNAFTNPTMGQVTLNGRQALVVSMFIPSEAQTSETGGVLYYRFLD